MASRKYKIHLYRSEEGSIALCGKKARNGSFDHEETTCKTCSGIYCTNMEWYNKIRNKVLVAKDDTGSGDIYTRQDVEAGLYRLGWNSDAIRAILDKTNIFRNVALYECDDLALWYKKAIFE